jgi:hypothetical protein
MAPLLIGLAAGAAGAFFMDPQQGRRRRSLVRDKVTHNIRQGREFRDAAARDLKARAQGAAAQLRAMRGGPVSDDVLIGRVRAKLGRYVSHPHAVRVGAQAGIVTLSGEVLASEHPRLIRAIRMVPGIRDCHDRLDVHRSAEGVSSLQGGVARSGEPLELLQAHWAPGTRAVVGGTGALLALYGLARGGFAGLAALAGGAALTVRAWANEPLRSAMARKAKLATQPEQRTATPA